MLNIALIYYMRCKDRELVPVDKRKCQPSSVRPTSKTQGCNIDVYTAFLCL